MHRPRISDFTDAGVTDWDDFEAHDTAYEEAEDEKFERQRIAARDNSKESTFKYLNLTITVPPGQDKEEAIKKFIKKIEAQERKYIKRLRKNYYKRKLSKVKTKDQINQEIKDIEEAVFLPDGRYKTGVDDNRKKKLAARMTFLRTCLLYLELCEPTEIIIRRDMATVEREIKALDDGYLEWLGMHQEVCMKYKNPKAYYLDKMGLPELKNKLRTYQYLLS